MEMQKAFKRDANTNLKKRKLDCYDISVVSYGCETRSNTNEMQNKIDASSYDAIEKSGKLKTPIMPQTRE